MNSVQSYRLVNQYDQLPQLIDGLSTVFLHTRHLPQKWSIHENMAHLGRYQEVFTHRIERILHEDTPQFERYIAEKDGVFPQWIQQDTSYLIEKTQQMRQILAQHLNSIAKDQWNLIGKHPKFGPMTLIDWTEFFLLHESHHFYTIFRLKEAFKAKNDRSSAALQ